MEFDRLIDKSPRQNCNYTILCGAIPLFLGIISYVFSPPSYHCESDNRVEKIAGLALALCGIVGATIGCYFMAPRVKSLFRSDAPNLDKCQAYFTTALFVTGFVVNLLGIISTARCL